MRAGVIAGIAAALLATAADATASCRIDRRPRLRPDIPHSIAWIEAKSRALVRRDARDLSSPLGKVLGGSGYSVEQTGFISNGQHSRYGRTFRVIGGMVDIRLDEPHPVDAIVPAWAGPWPRRSKNYKYSRRYGYVPYRAHFVAAQPVIDLMVDVDVRRRRVIGIQGGVATGEDAYDPLPGHCPLRPDPHED